MSEVPFFSICIPNFNYGSYVAETINSVLQQSFTDFEIIVADNASTDNSWDVISSLAKSDSRIRCFRNTYNVGFAPNLQKATIPAIGKYLILLSSDDLMLPGALQTYFDILSSQKEAAAMTVLHSAFDQIDGDGKYLRSVVRQPGNFSGIFVDKTKGDQLVEYRIEEQDPIGAARFALLTNKGIGAFLTICYPRELWMKVEGYDPQYFIFPDKAFLLKLLLLKPKYIYVNRILFGYRIHANNQNAKNQGQAALKHQVDGYMRVINFPEKALAELSLRRDDIRKSFVDTLCFQHALIALRDNQWLKAWRIRSFAFAAFPNQALMSRKGWALTMLLLLGPLGALILRTRTNPKTNVAGL